MTKAQQKTIEDLKTILINLNEIYRDYFDTTQSIDIKKDRLTYALHSLDFDIKNMEMLECQKAKKQHKI